MGGTSPVEPLGGAGAGGVPDAPGGTDAGGMPPIVGGAGAGNG
jgi:hypothetical protein